MGSPVTMQDLVSLPMLQAWGRAEADAEREGSWRLPPASVAAIRTSGVLGAPVPKALGGLDWDLGTTMAWLRGCAMHAPATALALAMPLGNAATCRVPVEAAPAKHRDALARNQAWIAGEVRKGRILGVANSEPGSGGDMANTKTVARPDGAGFRLTGLKAFATGGPDADYFLCAGRTPTGVDGFFVARDAAGVEVGAEWDGLGMRTSASVLLHLKDAPAAALLGYPGSLESANARHWSTLLFGAVFAGVGQGALQASKDSLRASVWHGRLAENLLRLDAAWGYLQAAAAPDAFPFLKERQVRAQRAKTNAALAAIEAATLGSLAAGGKGYGHDSASSKFLRDALAGPHLRPPLPSVLSQLASDWLA